MSSRKATITASIIATAIAGAAALIYVLGDATVATAATTTFVPTADTYVDSSHAATNFGTSGQLGTDNSPVKRMFLRFTVAGISAPVTSARLRVHTDDVSGSNSDSGGTFRLMSATGWSETAVTYNAQPAIDGVPLGSLGAVSRNVWYEIDVTGKITGNGVFSVGVTSTSTDGADYDSREAGTLAPQLVVTTAGPSPSAQPSSSPAPSGDPVLVGAGDISDAGSGDSATAALLDGIPGTVFTAGDNVYTDGTAAEFASFYEPTWGRHKARTRPAPGNHDYNTSGATGYYGYFGAGAGPSGRGYYSYDLGTWHIVSLNSEVSMAVGSAQEQWLRSDLGATTKTCILAYWHQPRFTSGAEHAPNTATGPLVQALYDSRADVVVTGHNHQYERFAQLNPSGGLDTANGARHFVAGMGGAGFYGFGTILPNSQVRNGDTHGVLKFTLHASSYEWQFVPEAGKTFTDSGSTACH